jgi:hypothetical protein
MKEAVSIVNAGKPRPLHQAGSQKLLPELLHLRRLGEEAVSAYIEKEPFVRYGSREAANNVVCLEDKWGMRMTSKLQCRAKASRTAAQDYGS